MALTRVEWRPTGATHSVWAGGSGADGSLHDFFTICGKHVVGDTGAKDNQWQERKAGKPSCGNCRRIIRSRRFREATMSKRLT